MKNSLENAQISLEQVLSALFFLGIFFIPFSSFQGVDALGEFKREASVFFFLAAFVLLIVLSFFKRKIKIPHKNPLFLVLLAIIVWFFISTLLNISNISGYYFKYTSGFNRFIRQYAVLIASALLFLITYYNVNGRYTSLELFRKVRTVFFWSLVVVSAYGFIEILIVRFKIGQLMPILKLFDYFPFTYVHLDPWNERISSVTFEPPALATYLLTVSGWMFSYIITNKGYLKFVPAVVVIALALFSGSRSGLVIMLVQAVLFALLLVKKRKYHQLLLKLLVGVVVAVLMIAVVKGPEIAAYLTEKATSFSLQDDKHSISNKSRFGMQTALYQVFRDHPVSGVGYGQQAFEAVKNLPPWATANNWEFKIKYLNPDHPSFPPGYNIFVRILAESGAVGFGLFVFWLLFILYSCFSIFTSKSENSVFALVLIVAMVGFIMNWMKMDTIRVFGFWIHFSFLLTLTRETSFKFAKK